MSMIPSKRSWELTLCVEDDYRRISRPYGGQPERKDDGRESECLQSSYTTATLIQEHTLDSGQEDIYMTSDVDSFSSQQDQTSSLGPTPTSDATLVNENDGSQGDITDTYDVCFGMICDVTCAIFDDLKFDHPIELTSTTSIPSAYRFHLKFLKQTFALSFPRGPEFANINTKTTNGLKSLAEFSSIRYEVYINTNEWTEIMKSWKFKAKKVRLTATINIYGSREISKTVGDRLSRAGLYLQHPDHCDPATEYENPHFFKLTQDQFPQLESFCEDTIPIMSIQPASSPNYSCVFDSLSRYKHLRHAEIDSRVTTPLLMHQKEAVFFVGQMEFGGEMAGFSLWETKETQGETYYQHKITGSKRLSCPDPYSGGILADDMGLGKSLTTLSNVIGSLDHARDYVMSMNTFSCVEANAIAPRKITAKTTLVIVPSALLLDGWVDELQKHIQPDSASYCKYHGFGREPDAERLTEFDIIFTTYGTITHEFCNGLSVLHQIRWFRIVLDEAHVIRHQSTKQFRAVFELESKFRWCLTGTPIQNSLEDLASLVKFLRIPQLDTMTLFRKHVIYPVENRASDNLRNLRLLLDSICLRRTKDLLNLPEPIEALNWVQLSPKEEEVYIRIGEESRMEIEAAISGHKTTKTYSSILRALLRLRILCNNDSSEGFSLIAKDSQKTCGYCSREILFVGISENPSSAHLTSCNHLICVGCLQIAENELDWDMHGAKTQCSSCSEEVTQYIAARSQTCYNNKLNIITPGLPPTGANKEKGYSSKISALLSNIEQDMNCHKSIIFSYWVKTLDVVARVFSKRGIEFIRIDGSRSLPDRRKVFASFQEDRGVNILLMTLGTGAVGLNLAKASRIHILEPQWNPSVEAQAIGRVLRMGQEKHVVVTRYIVKNTVEEFIRCRQSKKLHLASLGWLNNSEDGEEAKMKDLIDLKPLLYKG